MNNHSWFKRLGLLIGPVVFLLLLQFEFSAISPLANRVIALGAWMIIWWISEAVSISVTALLPMALFPILGVMELKTVTSYYSSPIIYLFFGGLFHCPGPGKSSTPQTDCPEHPENHRHSC